MRQLHSLLRNASMYDPDSESSKMVGANNKARKTRKMRVMVMVFIVMEKEFSVAFSDFNLHADKCELCNPVNIGAR